METKTDYNFKSGQMNELMLTKLLKFNMKEQLSFEKGNK
jgi:hypothetical protein